MSSRGSYSKESRSYYSRSSSCENNSRGNSSPSYRRRPLSSLLIERDFSSPSLAMDRFDDPFFFDRPPRRFLDDFDRRIRGRFEDQLLDDEFFENNSANFGRNIPINTRGYSSSTVTREIPVQYSSVGSNQQEKFYKKDSWASNSFNDGAFQRHENRLSMNDWARPQEPPTRKRTSMTIYLRQPRIQYSDVPNHQQTTTTTYRTNYY